MTKPNEMVYVVVRDSGDMHLTTNRGESMATIRGVFRSREGAQAWIQTLWDEGERPQARVESYFLRDDAGNLDHFFGKEQK